MAHAIDVFINLDKYLGAVITDYGLVTYAILFLIIFCETGLVVLPFLPGDSLLFAAGAFAALGSLNVGLLLLVLVVAAILGDTVNYQIGKAIGPRVVTGANSKFLNRKHLEKTREFYEKYGGKTIVFARFIPIIRTFAPFVAGVGEMDYKRFILFNAAGGAAWVTVFTFAGFFFGNLPAVKQNFSMVIFAIIFLSVLPAVVAYIGDRRSESKRPRA